MANERVVAELGVITRTVLSSPRLANVLSDPDIPQPTKITILDELGRGSFANETATFVTKVASENRRSGRAFAAALAGAVAEYVFSAAKDDGRLQSIETQLYELASLVRTNPNLRDALVNPLVTDSVKDRLLLDLLQGRAERDVVELARILVALDHGRDVDEGAEALSIRAAALRNTTIADVHTAIELGEEHRRRLTEALTHAAGKPVEPRFNIDPTILGSVIVRIGDDVLDGSVRRRLEQARETLLGAS